MDFIDQDGCNDSSEPLQLAFQVLCYVEGNRLAVTVTRPRIETIFM